MITVGLHGLEVFGHHGVGDDERAAGRTFVFDVEWDLAEPAVDDIRRTVDYREVAARVRGVSEARQFRLIEALCGAVADEVLRGFPVSRVRVRVRKPALEPAGLPVAHSSATVERFREERAQSGAT